MFWLWSFFVTVNVMVHTINSMNANVWETISKFSTSNTKQQLRLLSQNHKIIIDEQTDNDFAELEALINQISNDNFNEALLNQIHALIIQNKFLKSKLHQSANLLAKLLLPQIKKGKIITNTLKLKQIPKSNNIIEHFNYYLSLITTIKDQKDFEIYGALFGLKWIDVQMGQKFADYETKFDDIHKDDIVNAFVIPKSIARSDMITAFEINVFKMICNPLFYSSLNYYGEQMSYFFVLYWYESLLLHIEGYNGIVTYNFKRRVKWMNKPDICLMFQFLNDDYPELLNDLNNANNDNLYYISNILKFVDTEEELSNYKKTKYYTETAYALGEIEIKLSKMLMPTDESKGKLIKAKFNDIKEEIEIDKYLKSLNEALTRLIKVLKKDKEQIGLKEVEKIVKIWSQKIDVSNMLFDDIYKNKQNQQLYKYLERLFESLSYFIKLIDTNDNKSDDIIKQVEDNLDIWYKYKA